MAAGNNNRSNKKENMCDDDDVLKPIELIPLPPILVSAKDDKSENALLRSRIDEQSQLIMILKRRSDDAVLANRSLEKVKQELEKLKISSAEETEAANKKYNMLESRFADLASNHEEMIQFKDEYKRRNKELTESNSRLKEENRLLFSSTISEQDQQITELKRNLSDLVKQKTSSDQKLSATEKKLHDVEKHFQVFRMESENTLRVTEQRLNAKVFQLEQQLSVTTSSESNIQADLLKLKKEKDELLELAMSRGKVIQEKQSEIKRFEQKFKTVEKTMQDMKDKFESDLLDLTTDKQVMKVRQEMEKLQHQHENTVREYEAYKIHSKNLLEQEKELNQRLRHFLN